MIKKLILSIIILVPTSQSLGQVGIYTGETLENANEIVEFKKDEIWTATNSYIYKFENGGKQVTLFDNSNFNDQPGIIHTLAKGKDSLWMGCDSGIYKFDGQNWNKLAINGLPGPVTEIKFTIDYKMWFISGIQVYSWDGSTLKNENITGNSLATFQTKVYVGNQSFQNNGHVYFNGNWSILPLSTNFNTRKIWDIGTDGLGNLWAASHYGISLFDGNNWNDLYQITGGCNDLLILNNKAISSIKLTFNSGQNDGNLVQVSRFGNVDTLFRPTLEQDSENLVLANGWNNSILLGKNSPSSVFRFFPSLSSKRVYEELGVNIFKGGMAPNGDLFKNFSDQNLFSGLRSENRIAIFASSLWLSGKDQNGVDYASANTYGDGTDYFSGPISNVYDSLYVSKYNRVWKVSKTQVESHKSNFNSTNYSMPEAIKNWPGNGDQNRGEAQYFAPFIDRNFNGVYEPESGEYPDILGDQAIFSICNDSRGPKRNTFGQSLGIEVHSMIYCYDTVSYTPLHNTLFIRYKVLNRSNNNYSNIKLGLWIDADLGNARDDLLGCDSVNDMFYFYNGDNDDEGPNGYGLFPPAVAGLFLSNSMSGFSYYANGGSAGVPAQTTDPDNTLEVVQYMNGKWKNGDPLRLENPSGFGSTLNGDGYDLSGQSPITRFAYNMAANWYQSPINVADLRSLPILDIGNLNAGEHNCIDYAIVYGRDLTDPTISASLNLVQSQADSVKNFYSKQNYACLGESIGIDEENLGNDVKLEIYPNPISGGRSLSIDSKENLFEICLIDLQGRNIRCLGNRRKGLIQMKISRELKKGLYLLKISNSNGNISTYKIVID